MFRKFCSCVRVLAIGAVLLPAAALADDPQDPAMRSDAAHARDRAIVRRMNQDQLAYVRHRDARSQQTYDGVQNDGDATYAEARAEYARKIAAWRHAVAACNAGRWEYCAN